MEIEVPVRSSKFFNITILDPKDELEERYENASNFIKNLLADLTETEIIDRLTTLINRDREKEEMIYEAMLMTILTEPSRSEKVYQDLRLLNRDGFHTVTQDINILIMDKYNNLLDSVRTQLLWLIREMVRNMIPNVDSLCWNLLRNAAGGDCSPKNLYLIDSMLDLFQENRRWLDKFPWLVAAVVYSFLRLLEDHSNAALAKLRQKEVMFVVSLLRDRFSDCLVIGRDLIRLLQNVSRIPEIELIWRDIQYNPSALCPNFTGVLQLLQTRTSRRFLQSRLTFDMERKLVYITSNVKFGSHKRYQDWFQTQYLSTVESQTLRSDYIRFIVGVIHPTNELLNSDIIPRWAVIGWLMTGCNSNVALANAKLALFYDWLFFDPERDNIMNIEPAVLVMTNSLRTHPAVTASLLDFLCKIIPNYYPLLSEKIRFGVKTSFQQILEKRVLNSLLPLFDNPRLDPELRNVVRENFGEFYDTIPNEVAVSRTDDAYNLDKVTHPSCPPPFIPVNNFSSDNSDDVYKVDECFSSDEDIDPLVNNARKQEFDEQINSIGKVKVKKPSSDIPIDSYRCLTNGIKLAVQKLHNDVKSGIKRHLSMENIIKLLCEDDTIENDIITNLAVVLSSVLRPFFEDNIFPNPLNEESAESSLSAPYFLLFKNLLQYGEHDSKKNLFILLLSEMRSYQPKIGYLLLYYLQIRNIYSIAGSSSTKTDSKLLLYKDFCHMREKKFEECFLSDLQICQEEEVDMFVWLIPAVYQAFSRFAVNNDQLLHLIVSTIDPKQLQHLVFKIIQGQFIMFRSDAFNSLVASSLTWESLEQFCFWHLATAHNISLETMLNSLPKLDFHIHNEAISTILLLLKMQKPSVELLKPIFCRELKPKSDTLVSTILYHWCSQYVEETAVVISDLLTSRCPTASPNKRKRGQGQGLGAKSGVSPPSAERILGHLDRLIEDCKKLFQEECMQNALRIAHAACTDTQKELYSNLFVMLNDEDKLSTGIAGLDENTSSSSSGGKNNNTFNAAAVSKGRGRRPNTIKNNKGRSVASTRSSLKAIVISDESSEEEEIIKPRNTKKRKQLNLVTSDSD